MNLWQSLKKPIIGLSPMDGVTTAPYREIVKKVGNPDVIFTEFVHVQALWRGKLDVYKGLIYKQKQRPIIAQLFGSEPDYFYKAAHIICELGFDGIDINMGCPAKAIVKRGGGASLIKNPNLAKDIIFQTKKGVVDWAGGQSLDDIGLDKEKINYIYLQSPKQKKGLIPVSVKTRTGFSQSTLEEWIKYLIEASPAAITVHGRTFSQLYTGKADWEAIASVSQTVRSLGIIYLGNGDVRSLQEGLEKCEKYNLDGVLIGRAALGNPWIFRDKQPTTEERLTTLLKHSSLHLKVKGERSFPEMKKHFGWYCRGFLGAKELRIKLLATKQLSEAELIIQNSGLI
jgi:tRNA-dihydrouridine synthase B